MAAWRQAARNTLVMIKNMLLLAASAVAVALSSCSRPAESASLAEGAITVDSLLGVAETRVGDTLVVRGFVRHTCKKSGRRCFISDSERQSKMRVEAGGQIGSFDPSLIGQEVAVRGVLREKRTSMADVEKALEAIEAKMEGEAEAGDACETTLNTLAAKKAYMELKGRDYYSDFFMDGLDYEVISPANAQ